MKLTLTKQQLHNYNQQRPASARSCVCFAPLSSMYLGFRGYASVCCANRTHIIGKYPEQSLREMWMGEKINQLRTALQEADFSKGCMPCHNLIEAENYTNLPAKNFDALGFAGKTYPSKIDFELSNTCNLECIMCRGEFSSAIRKNRDKKPPILSPYDDAFVEQLKEFIPHLEQAHFLGGEPFLIQIYLDIWELMIALNPQIRISVQTNGTVMTPRVRQILEQLNFNISVSIDSLTPSIYEAIRVNGNLEKTLQNIHYFIDYCARKNTFLTLSFCPMPQNVHEIPQLLHFGNRHNLKIFLNTVLFPKEYSLTSLPAPHLLAITQSLPHPNTLPQNTQTAQYNKAVYQDFLQQLNYWQSQSGPAYVPPAATFNQEQSFFAQLQQYCNQLPNITPSDKEQLYSTIAQKLQELLHQSEQFVSRQDALAQLVKVDFKTIVQNVPSTDPEGLFIMFKSAFLVTD